MIKKGLRLNGVAFIPQTTHNKMTGTKVQTKDLLLNITGGSIGRCCIVSNNFDTVNINQHVAIIRTILPKNACYLHSVIRSTYFQNRIIKVQTGAGREGLPKNKMDNILTPLPPLAEQKAIVEKVESLMQQADAISQGANIEDYLYYMLSSDYTYNSFKESARGGVVQNLNIDKVKETIIPTPPLAEQKAIAEKVESLMQKVSTMEDEIKKSEQNANMLMQAVLKESFEVGK